MVYQCAQRGERNDLVRTTTSQSLLHFPKNTGYKKQKIYLSELSNMVAVHRTNLTYF